MRSNLLGMCAAALAIPSLLVASPALSAGRIWRGGGLVASSGIWVEGERSIFSSSFGSPPLDYYNFIPPGCARDVPVFDRWGRILGRRVVFVC